MTKKHFIFDMDGTLTESKTLITFEMIAGLNAIKGDITIISGASLEQMHLQMGSFSNARFMPQSGAVSEFWEYIFTNENIKVINKHIRKILDDTGLSPTDKIQNRGSQVAFSFVGHNASWEIKKNYDPKATYRSKILKKFPFKDKEIVAKIAGTSCIDYTHKNYTKGKNIARLIKQMKWKKEECIYFGDAFYPLGNDTTVKGVIDIVAVKDPVDLLKKLQKYD